MGLFGGSKRSRSSTTNTTNTTNLNQTGVEEGAIAVANSDANISIVSTDQGALSLAGDLADQSFGLSESVALDALNVADNSLDRGFDIAQDAFSLSERVVDLADVSSAAAVQNAFDFGGDTVELVLQSQANQLDFGTNAIDNVVDFARDAFSSNQDFLLAGNENLIGTINDITQRESLNNDARIADLSGTVVRGAGLAIAAALVAVVFLLRRT